MRKRTHRPDRLGPGEWVDSLGPVLIGAALIVLLILMAWGCHGATS